MIKVAIIEDNETYVSALCAYINTTDDITIVHTDNSVDHLMRNKKHQSVDVVVLDINLGRESGIDGISKIRNHWPKAGIFMLTVFEDEEKISQSIKAGAMGYLLKKDPPEKVVDAIRSVHNGESILNGKVARIMLEQYSKERNKTESLQDHDLSKRELEVVGLLLKGLSYKEIAAACFISVDTLNSHIRRIYTKLNVHSRAEIAARFR